MDGHSFLPALLYALFGINTFISWPMQVYTFSLQSSSLSSTLLDSLIPATPIVDEPHNKQMTINADKDSNNDVGSDESSKSIPISNAKQRCTISEWQCPNGTCISLSKYCNGVPDCLPDKSDEPNECSGKHTLLIYIIYGFPNFGHWNFSRKEI